MDAEEIKSLYSKIISYENVPLNDGTMTPRERFFNIMNFKKIDRIIDTEFGYWDNTLKRWHNEGLPSYIDSNEKADIYFGFDVWKKAIPIHTKLFPWYEEEVIEDDGKYKVYYTGERVKCQVFTDGTDSIPHYLDFPIKDRDSYRKLFKDRLTPTLERIMINLKSIAEEVNKRNYILEIYGGSTAGDIRDWMGFENICLAIYDQPELLEEILEDKCRIGVAIAEEIVKYFTIDLVAWWEDIAFKTGPIVTPDFFINKCGPIIKKIMDVYRDHGTNFGFVDCDGDFRLLMPGWLNNGINIMFPLEVNAGIHPAKLRKAHPGIRMMGGVDKVVLSGTKDDIKNELLKLKPLVNEGGYIPHVDHRVQSDVPYSNYLYYLEVKRDIFNIPNKIKS